MYLPQLPYPHRVLSLSREVFITACSSKAGIDIKTHIEGSQDHVILVEVPPHDSRRLSLAHDTHSGKMLQKLLRREGRRRDWRGGIGLTTLTIPCALHYTTLHYLSLIHI